MIIKPTHLIYDYCQSCQDRDVTYDELAQSYVSNGSCASSLIRPDNPECVEITREVLAECKVLRRRRVGTEYGY